jgi:hypothetical protein
MDRADREPSNLGVTLTFIAGLLLIATGLTIAMYGLSSLFAGTGRSTDFPVHIGATVWSVIHLCGGIVLAAAGANLFMGKPWARIVAMAVAAIALLAGLVSIDAYPVWGILMVLLNVGIIWSLARHYGEARFE